MRPVAKLTVGLLSALILAAPLSLGIWIWRDFHQALVREQHQTADVIMQFHERFNARDFDAICREAYKCSESPNLRQDWQSALEDTRNRGGAFRNVLRSDIKVFIEPASVRADIVSAFEKTELREIFEMRNFDGPLRIISYRTVTKDASGVP